MPKFDFFSDAFFPDWTGGLQRYATELAAVADRHGFEGVLWTREWRRGGLMEVSEAVGDKTVVRSVLGSLPFRIRGAVISAAAVLGVKLGRPTGDCKIFHTSILGAAFMRKFSDRPQVYVFHASAGHELLVEAASRGKVPLAIKAKAALLLRLERKCLQYADLVVVLSRFSRQLLQELHPSRHHPKILVIPGGTAVEAIGEPSSPDVRSRSRRIVVLRRLEWRMGIDLLLEAFANARASREGWQIDIVGTGSQDKALQALAAKLGLSSSVTFHGRVPEDKKRELLDDAVLSVLPTRALEGFGLATVEAMARGVIPIVTSAGASPEIVEELDERLVCSPTVESISAAIDYWTLERSAADRSRLSEICYAAAQRYGWEPVFAAYLTAISELPAFNSAVFRKV